MVSKKTETGCTKVNTSKESDMDLANSNGTTVNISKVSGVMVKKTDMVYGNLQKEIITKVNGRIIDRMGRGIIVM